MRTPSVLVLAALLLAACNEAPTEPVVDIEPADATTLDDLQAVLSTPAVDSNDDPITYTWAWSVDGIAVGDLNSDQVPADRTGRDEVWTVEVFASDGKEDSPVAQAEVAILNSAPTVTLDLQPAAPLTTDDLVATATPADDDGDEVTLTWSWKRDGGDAGIDSEQVPAAETASREAWEVTVVASDGDLESEPVSASVSIDNTAPVATSAVLEPSAIFDAAVGEDSVVSVIWTGSDADDDDLTAEISWFVDGMSVEGNSDATLDGRSFAKGSRISAEVVLSDGLDTSEPLRTDEVLVQNSPPTLASVSLDPSLLTETTTATCVPAGWLDQDGDAPTYLYSWTVGGVEVGSGSTLDGSAWSRGDQVSCTITPFDGEDPGTPVSSAPVTVANTPPTLGSVSLSPDPVRTADTLTPVPGATADVDGDRVSVSYAWTVNGASAGSGTSLASSRFSKGDTVLVTATPSDGTDSGTPRTAALTVSNTAPVVTALTLSPTSPTTTDTIGATFTTSDIDDDPVTTTVTWTVDGASAGTGTSLPSSAFGKGDVIVASAVASDGVDSSAPRTATVTAVNSAPTTPGVSMTPSAPTTSQAVRCAIVRASTDADSDSISYSFSWTINGSSFTGTTRTVYAGDTVPASATSARDTVRCSVTASDGTATSSAATASATVTGGATVPGFSGEVGPTFSGWTQCEGYLDKVGGDQIPTAWGNDCTGSSYGKVKLVCGASTSSYRYIDVNRNVFRLGLTGYPQRGLITAARNQSGTSFSIDNVIYATSNNPNAGTSWWNGPQGCGSTNLNITVNNGCTWEASNCFGQGLGGDRYLWVYVAP